MYHNIQERKGVKNGKILTRVRHSHLFFKRPRHISDCRTFWPLINSGFLIIVMSCIAWKGADAISCHFYIKLIFSEKATKNWRNLHRRFDTYYITSNRRWRFRQSLWPSLKTWTLQESKFQTEHLWQQVHKYLINVTEMYSNVKLCSFSADCHEKGKM